MEKLGVFLAAIFLVVVGARGTYKAIWNSFFPNEPIVTTPVSTLPGPVGQPGGASGPVGTGNKAPGGPISSSNPTYNPVAAGSQAGTTVRKWITGAPNGTVAPGTSGNNSNVPSVNVPPGKQAIVSTGIPSWWPSWLPWPGNLINYYPGEGYTGQQRNAP